MCSVGTSVRIPAAPTVRAIRAKGLPELLVVVGPMTNVRAALTTEATRNIERD